MKWVYGRYHLMFEAFIPYAVENDIRHVQLADLDYTEGDHTYEYEFDTLRINLQETREEPNGNKTDERPEENLDEMKDPLSGDEHVFIGKAINLDEVLSKVQEIHPPNPAL